MPAQDSIHNSSPKTALTQPGMDSIRQDGDGKDTLLYPKPDGSHPVSSGFPMPNSSHGA